MSRFDECKYGVFESLGSVRYALKCQWGMHNKVPPMFSGEKWVGENDCEKCKCFEQQDLDVVAQTQERSKNFKS